MWPFPDRRPLGRRGEALAARYLRRRGWRILARNLREGRFELDLVVQRGDTTVFVEVKTRRSVEIASPEANITAQKQRHIRSAARRYMETHYDSDRYYRYDVVTVVMPERGKPVVAHIENAFEE